MAITSVYPNVMPYVGNPATDMLKRENARRDIIVPVAAAERQAAGQSTISEEKNRSQSQSQLTYEAEVKGRHTETREAIESRSDEQSPDEQESQEQSSGSQRDNLSQEEQQQLDELKARDEEVRRHEQAHAAAGGQHAGSPSYEFEAGPDGQQYAVGGEVPIDISPINGDPQATIAKMQQVRRAALAPAEPSGADRRIAAEASAREAQARSELAAQFGADPEQASDQSQAMSTEAPQQLEQEGLMQVRRQVISGFYQQVTVPQDRPLRLTA